ncbi:MAG TPA: hypothetical protein VG692_11685 [Gemmatimonadales bacterium]|nr:hypothetical protein [Gemmatimonadales bacterium]
MAERFLTSLVAADSQSLARELDTNLTSPQSWLQVLAVRDSFDLWQPDSLRLIGWNIATFNTDHVADLTYQLFTTRGWMIATVNLKGASGAMRVRGFHWQFLPDRLDRVNRFALSGKPIGAYLVLVLALAMASISLGTALYLPFTDLPRRWAWAALALLGCTRFDLNWTTGATALQLLTLQLFSAGFQRVSNYAPWIISVSFPFGAMLAWRRILAWRRAKRSEAAG